MVHCRVLQIEGVCVVDYGYPIITQGNFMLTVILNLMHTLREMLYNVTVPEIFNI